MGNSVPTYASGFYTNHRLSWDKLLCADRLTLPGTQDTFRSPFEKDWDKLIFSHSFRRLCRKTQVHPLALNDHIHNRLTHSLEVASVGRCLGRAIGEIVLHREPQLNHFTADTFGAVVQAACLAHDIGNPPFGHAGEEAIRQWMTDNSREYLDIDGIKPEQKTDFTKFEGNAQGFRIISTTESLSGSGGLQLTLSTLGAVVKYPWYSDDRRSTKNKFGFFRSEEEIVDKLTQALGLSTSDGRYHRHPLSFLMEAADDICYRIMDLEDAWELDMVPTNHVTSVLQKLSGDSEICAGVSLSRHGASQFSQLRAKAIANLIEKTTDIVKDNYESLMFGEFQGSLLQHLPELEKEGMDRACEIAETRIFPTQRKVELELGCYSSLRTILAEMMKAAKNLTENKTTFKDERILELIGGADSLSQDPVYIQYMKVTDFVSGMTDNYATHIANRLNGKAQ